LLFVGLGPLPLWTLVLSSAPALGLVARSRLGTVLGLMAVHQRLLRMGAPAARGALQCRDRVDIRRPSRRTEFRFWPERVPFYVRGHLPLCRPSHCGPRHPAA